MSDVIEPNADANAQNKTRFKILFLIVLADMVGFGIILPLLPIYARDFGASEFQATLLLSAYSLCQFIAAPLLGSLSDRVGRRPVLILSQAGSAIASITLAFATAVHFGNPLIGLAIIYVSRFVDGFSGGNLSAAQAYVSDIVEPQHKAKFMGLLGAAFGIGFALGPGIGGLLASIHPALAPLAAAAFSVTAALLSYRKLPESLKEPIHSTDGHFVRSLRLMREPILAQINLVWFLSMFAFVMSESVFALFLQDRFAFSPMEIGLMFTLAGVVIIIVQGRLIGPLTRMLGEWNLATFGPLIFAGAMLLYTHIALHPVFLLLITAAILNAVGRSLQTPSISVLISHQAKGNQQGAVFGLFQGFGSLARVFGPATAGKLYMNGHLGRPFGVAGVVIACGSIWTMLIRLQMRGHARSAPAGLA
ncbi:MAG: MFS transporter [Tepidisphaeraceae bacterium]